MNNCYVEVHGWESKQGFPVYKWIKFVNFIDFILMTNIPKLLFSFFLFASGTVYSQRTYSPADSAKVWSWLNRADDLAAVSLLDSASHFVNLALHASNEKRMLRGQAYAHLKVADIAYRKNETSSLVFHDSIALKIAAQLKDSFLLALAHYQLGQYYLEDEKYEEAHRLFNKALAIRFAKDQSSYTAVVFNDIGFTYGAQGQLDKQVDWYLKAIRVYEKNKDRSGMAQTVSNLSTVYNQLGNRKEALAYAKEAMALRENNGDVNGLSISCNNISQLYLGFDSLDQAIKYQQLGLKYAEKSGVKLRISNSFISMALLLNRQKKNKEALEYEKKAIAILLELNDLGTLSRRYIAAAILSKAMNDSVTALDYFQKAYDLSVQLKNKENLRDIYLHKAIYYKDRKDFFNAYEHYKKYILYRDSLISAKTRSDIAEIETRYETEKKDYEIARLNTEQKIRQLEIEKQKAIISGNTLLAKQKENEIILLSQERELQDSKIKQQDQELEKQLLIAKNNEQLLLLSEQEKQLKEKELKDQKLLQQVIVGAAIMLVLFAGILFNRYKLKKKLEQQNQLLSVRNDIAKDLHDEIGSTLTSIKILSEVSKNNLEKDQQKAFSFLQKITEQSSQMQQGMSDIVWAIKPDNDKLENMLVRMREYASHTLEPKNIETIFIIEEAVLAQSLNMQQRRDFFLIFKEAINNAAKYSQAGKVEITISKETDQLHLRVSDNGIGFDCAKETSSNGLKNMMARAEALKGSVQIHSAPGKGTTVLAKVPAIK
jgi:two-component system sensor histidine kinase UhpB